MELNQPFNARFESLGKETFVGTLTSVLLQTPPLRVRHFLGSEEGPTSLAPVLSSFRTRDSKLIGGQACFTAQGRFLRHFPASHSLRSEDGVRQWGRCCVCVEALVGRGAEGGFSVRNILQPAASRHLLVV